VRRISNRKLLGAALVALIGGAICVASLPVNGAIIGPNVCSYYKDATYRKVVGARGTGCCGQPISWGVVSAFKKCQTLYCLDVLCPD